jgi:CubicO group peptidase (beta-lactamase class C family)
MTLADALTDVDAVFDRFAARAIAPGFAYGVIVDGSLVHAKGQGTLRTGTEAQPGQDSVFRIASMTKSFTAAAILLLRDEDRLRLDDPVATWVPELASAQATYSADSPPVTIGSLLTMSAGLPTDDPWGDRQQGLPLRRFAAVLRESSPVAWPPGTRFEYSNLGYGILGRVISNVAGLEYKDFVRARLLEPLGMTATTYLEEEIPAGRLAHGYVRRDGDWLEEPIDPYGALASMGGVFTSVDDLSRWVAGFIDAFPPRDGPDRRHPLRRATRREMQQVHRSIDPELTWVSAESPPSLIGGGYGYGLFVADDLRLGRVVGHGGGYPGFGSNMQWHPASGLGLVALGNARYAPMFRPVYEALAVLVDRLPERVRRIAPWPRTNEARTAVERLLDRWDDGEATRLFSMNVDLDIPLVRRRAAIEELRGVHGALEPDPSVEPETHSPAHLAWWMRGERGRVRVEMLMSPERPSRVQSLTLASVPEPPPALLEVAQRLAALLGTPGPVWPADLRLAPGLDGDAVARALRAAEARFGPVTLGDAVAVDEAGAVTWRLVGDRGEVELKLGIDPATGALTVVAFVPRSMEPPLHAV